MCMCICLVVLCTFWPTIWLHTLWYGLPYRKKRSKQKHLETYLRHMQTNAPQRDETKRFLFFCASVSRQSAKWSKNPWNILKYLEIPCWLLLALANTALLSTSLVQRQAELGLIHLVAVVIRILHQLEPVVTTFTMLQCCTKFKDDQRKHSMRSSVIDVVW